MPFPGACDPVPAVRGDRFEEAERAGELGVVGNLARAVHSSRFSTVMASFSPLVSERTNS
jgi:hypothetical protein